MKTITYNLMDNSHQQASNIKGKLEIHEFHLVSSYRGRGKKKDLDLGTWKDENFFIYSTIHIDYMCGFDVCYDNDSDVFYIDIGNGTYPSSTDEIEIMEMANTLNEWLLEAKKKWAKMHGKA